MDLHLSMDTGPIQRLWPHLRRGITEGHLTVDEAFDVVGEEIVKTCTVEGTNG